MQTLRLVSKVEALSIWTGIDIHVKKSEITAHDFARKVPLETDHIRLLGSAFKDPGGSFGFKALVLGGAY